MAGLRPSLLLPALLLASSAAAQVQTSAGVGALYPAGAVAVGGRDANGLIQPLASDTIAGGATLVIPAVSARGAFGASRVAVEQVVTALQFPYTINTYLTNVTTANGGTVTQANAKAQIQTSANVAGLAKMESRKRVRYIPGQGVIVRFTALLTPCAASSTQEIGIGDDSDGFFFGCFGGSFGLDRRQNGVDNVIPQSAWNGDRMDGTGPSGQTVNIGNGNVYAIQYQWLGFGAVRFFIEDQITGEFVQVHVIRYANSSTLPTIFNPTLPLHAKAVNSGNATNVLIQTASMGAAFEGPPNPEIGARHAVTYSKGSVPTTGLSLFAVQNVTTFDGTTNRTDMRIDNASFRVAGNADGYFAIVRNPTLGGPPSFVPLDLTNSIAAMDVSGTTVTGGQVLFMFSGSGTGVVDLSDYMIDLHPGDVLTCEGFSENATITSRCSLGWVEEF